jgi:hypothetical protein
MTSPSHLVTDAVATHPPLFRDDLVSEDDRMQEDSPYSPAIELIPATPDKTPASLTLADNPVRKRVRQTKKSSRRRSREAKHEVKGHRLKKTWPEQPSAQKSDWNLVNQPRPSLLHGQPCLPVPLGLTQLVKSACALSFLSFSLFVSFSLSSLSTKNPA